MKIFWEYFFGGSGGNTFDRYYKSEINGFRVEKHASNKGSCYSKGNIDEAKVKYKTEAELISACTQPDKTETQIRHCNICNTGKIRVESKHYLKKGLSEIHIDKCDNCNYHHDLETIFDCELVKE